MLGRSPLAHWQYPLTQTSVRAVLVLGERRGRGLPNCHEPVQVVSPVRSLGDNARLSGERGKAGDPTRQAGADREDPPVEGRRHRLEATSKPRRPPP